MPLQFITYQRAETPTAVIEVYVLTSVDDRVADQPTPFEALRVLGHHNTCGARRTRIVFGSSDRTPIVPVRCRPAETGWRGHLFRKGPAASCGSGFDDDGKGI